MFTEGLNERRAFTHLFYHCITKEIQNSQQCPPSQQAHGSLCAPTPASLLCSACSLRIPKMATSGQHLLSRGNWRTRTWKEGLLVALKRPVAPMHP